MKFWSRTFVYLKYPYGIWNYSFSGIVGRETNLKYPYGIWNQDISEKWRAGREFEVSLWDLKLNHIVAGVPADDEFEVSLWDLKQKGSWYSAPDAFAFEVSLWDLKRQS